jgi:hypothetical protein
MLFSYLTNEIEFEQDILQGRVSLIISSTCVMFLVNLDDLFVVVYKDFTKVEFPLDTFP